MKFVVAKKDMMVVLAKMREVTDSKSTVVAHAMVLLSTKGPNHLEIGASRNIVSLTAALDAEVSEQGATAVRCEDLHKRVVLMPDGPLRFEKKGDELTLKAPGTARKYILSTIDPEEMTRVPDGMDGPWVSVPVKELRTLLRTVTFAMGHDSTRPHLHGAFFSWEGPRLRMVATDGHRISLTDCEVPSALASVEAMLSENTVEALSSLAWTAKDETLRMAFRGQDVFAEAEGYRFTGRLPEAKFPPYQQVIPKKWAIEATVSRLLMLEALRAVAVATDKRMASVFFDIGKGKVAISAGQGVATDEVVCDYVGERISIGLNPKYMIDVFEALEDDDVKLCISDPLAPVVIQPIGLVHTSVVMPLRN